jgi:N6-adenosine-specific RNA methylase IME4
VVTYSSEPDQQDRSKTNLLRRETRRLSAEKADQTEGATDILFGDLAKLELAYWDVRTREWRDAWSTSGADANANKLPDRVRIKLIFLDENGKEVVLTTEARIYLQEVISFYAN